MTKVFCDRCGKEIEKSSGSQIQVMAPLQSSLDWRTHPYDLCQICDHDFWKWLNRKEVDKEDEQ